MTQNNNNKLRIMIDGTLPWDKQEGENRRLYGFIIVLLLLCLLVMIMVESITIEKPDRKEQQKIPDRLAQMVLEKKKEPPPPEPEPEPEPEKEQEKPKEEEPKAEEPKPEPKPEPRPDPTPQQRDEARATAKARLDEDLGDSLAGLDDIGPLVSAGNELRTGGSSEAKAERDLIGTRASTGSGGVAVAKASSGGGGGGTLSSGTAGSSGKVDSKIAAAGQAASTTRKGSDGKSRRTQEQIRRVFDRYSGKFNSQYQRALRSNPALQGTVVLSLVIAPSGEVTDAKIKSSQLNDAALERRILLITKGMNFNAMNVETWKGDYKLNFFPN